MTSSTAEGGSWRLAPAVRALRGPAVVAAVYAALRVAFEALTEDDGLLTPSGAPSVGVVALGLAVLALRMIVVCALPAVCAYRIVMLAPRAARHPPWRRRASPRRDR